MVSDCHRAPIKSELDYKKGTYEIICTKCGKKCIGVDDKEKGS